MEGVVTEVLPDRNYRVLLENVTWQITRRERVGLCGPNGAGKTTLLRMMAGLEEAVQAYTLGSAYAEFQEKEKGSLTPGKLADLVILSEDIFAVAPEAIKDVRVEATVVGGRFAWRRP